MPFGRNNPRQGVGKPIQARTINRPARGVEGLTRINLGPGVQIRWVDGIPLAFATPIAHKRIAKVVGGSIPARTDTSTTITAGQGSGILMQATADGWTTDRGEPVTLWNTANGDDIPENAFVQVSRADDGRWVVDVADC